MKYTFIHSRSTMKCTGVAVRRSANHLPRTYRGSDSYLTCVLFTSFLFSSLLVGLRLSLNQTRKEQASNDCLATSNTCQTKNRAEDREKKRGPATIPRPSFTNYTEYLLTGGLSQCLLSHPTPLIFPPFNIPSLSHPALLQFTTCCGEEAPQHLKAKTAETKEKKKEDKEDTEEDSESFGSETRALIRETFKSEETGDEKVIGAKVRSSGR